MPGDQYGRYNLFQYDNAQRREQNITLLAVNDETDSCFNLRNSALTYNDAGKYQQSYDTVKKYIEHCFAEAFSYTAFFTSVQAVSGLDKQGNTLWASYRDWLKKVLYYNPDTNYYCTDLLCYAESFERNDENGKAKNEKTTLAIFKYLLDSTNCGMLRSEYNQVLRNYYRHWKDTVTDSLKTPLDTNYASLDDLDQGFLRGFALDVDIRKPTPVSSLGELTAEKNPFTTDAVIHYITNAPTVAKLEVYDALGKMLWTNGQGYLEPGEHSATINGGPWSSGAYYIRLVTLKGEIKTCKLIKE